MSQSYVSSAELLERCLDKGLLTKEAHSRVAERRKQLIKEAIIGRLRRAREAASKAPVPKGFWERLKKSVSVGGKTTDAAGAATLGEAGGKAPAEWPDVTANIGKLIALAGLTTAGVSGVTAVGKHLKRRARDTEIDKSYKEMFREFPELRQLNQPRVRSHFGALRRYAPSLAANPLVAGSIVYGTVRQGQMDPAMIHTLAKTQQIIDHEPGRGGLGEGLGIAQAAMAGLGGG